MDIWALVPVKSLQESKRRLSHLLPVEQRAELISGLLQRELSILNQVPAIGKVLVISSDPTVWDIARQNGALVEEEPQSLGLNVAVTHGMSVAAQNGASAVLILPVDLPFISTSDVDLMISSGPENTIWDQSSARQSDSQGTNGFHRSHQPACAMVICSDVEGDGTNALFVNPAQEFTFHFGPGSFQNHIQEAEKRGLQVQIISTPGLSFDIDNEGDWFTYQASRLGC
jgi:2-phospho-L-lactate guanylyltransferase